MYSSKEVSRLNPLTSTQPIQMAESNKKEPVMVKISYPTLGFGEPKVEFVKKYEESLQALKAFALHVSVESQVIILGKLYETHTLNTPFDEALLVKYNAFKAEKFLDTPFIALKQYFKGALATDHRFINSYAKLGLIKNESLHREVMEYLTDKAALQTTSKNCAEELEKACDIVKPYLMESEKLVENRSKEVIGKYKIENDHLIDQLNEAKHDIKELSSQIEQLQFSKKETEANLTIAEEKHEELTNRKSLTEEKIAMSHEKMAEYFTENTDAIDKDDGSKELHQEYEKLLAIHKALEIEYTKIEESLTISQSGIETLENKLLLSTQELEQLEQAKANSTKEIENLREELRLSRLTQESSELKYKSEIIDLTSQLKQKEEIKVQQVENEKLMSELARLLEIEKKYNALLLETENSNATTVVKEEAII